MDSIIALSAGADHVLVVRTNDEAPVIRSHPRSVFPALGSATNFSVAADSSLALTFQWQRQVGMVWSNLTGATNTTLTFTNVQDSASGIYRAQVSTALRSIHSRTALLEVLHAPVIASQAPELELRRPQFVTEILSVLITNQGARFLHYEWFQNGAPVPMAVGSTFFLYFNRTNSEGDYHVVVSNPAGRATSAVWSASVTLRGEATLWGSDSYGQLSGRSRHETNLVAIAAGGYHTLGLRENGTVIAWGRNNRGQTDVPGGLTNVVAVAGGYEHSVALLDDGTVRVWGETNYGQTPIPAGATNITMIAAGGDQVLALRRDGQLLAWGVTPVPSGVSNIIAMSAGYEHALALHSNGTVQAWNNFGFPDMTPPGGLSNVVQVASGAYHALALRRDGTVTGWGENTYGEATPPAGLSNVMKIVAGHQFNMALRNDGTVVSWGENTSGQTNVPNGLGDIRDIAAGTDHSAALAYNDALEYPVNVAQDLLLIYNTNSADSSNVCAYYLAHRPMVSQANVFGIGYAPQEMISRSDFTNAIRTPVLNWLAENPTKRPKYWVLFLDVPSRINEHTNANEYIDPLVVPFDNSVSYELSLLPQARYPLITHINMGNTNFIADIDACRAYIDKLAHFGSNYSPGRVVISASQGGYNNSQYCFDFVRNNAATGLGTEPLKSEMIAAGVAASNILSRNLEPHVNAGTNVTGYLTEGIHGWHNQQHFMNEWDYARDGTVVFTGQSAWYILMSRESENGLRFWISTRHGNLLEWFSDLAFGGTNFSNTPVGAVSHTDEPTGNGVNNPRVYFTYWALGKRFSTAAWASRQTEHFQAIGDPFTRR